VTHNPKVADSNPAPATIEQLKPADQRRVVTDTNIALVELLLLSAAVGRLSKLQPLLQCVARCIRPSPIVLQSTHNDARGDAEPHRQPGCVVCGPQLTEFGLIAAWNESLSSESVGFIIDAAVLLAAVDEGLLLTVKEKMAGLVKEGEPDDVVPAVT